MFSQFQNSLWLFPLVLNKHLDIVCSRRVQIVWTAQGDMRWKKKQRGGRVGNDSDETSPLLSPSSFFPPYFSPRSLTSHHTTLSEHLEWAKIFFYGRSASRVNCISTSRHSLRSKRFPGAPDINFREISVRKTI